MNAEQIRFHAAEILRLMPDSAQLVAPGIAIASRSELDKALAAAKGGEIFRLAPGDYGSLEWKPQFGEPVTLIGGTFGSVKLGTPHWKARGKGVILDGVKATYLEAKAFDNVTFLRCEAEQILIETASNVLIERCWLHDGHFPLRILRTDGFRVIGNVMEGAREDTMRIYGDTQKGEVRGNVFLNNMAAKPMHGDHLQIYGISGEDTCPRDLVIEQNLFHDDATGKKVTVMKTGAAGEPAPAQGVFVGAGQKTGYRNVSIRHNLMRLSMANSIFIAFAPENYRIEENIVAAIEGQQQASIRLMKDDRQAAWNNNGVTVRRNIVPRILHETPEAVVEPNNHVTGWTLKGFSRAWGQTTVATRRRITGLPKDHPFPPHWWVVGWSLRSPRFAQRWMR